MDYFSYENSHASVLGYGESRYQSEDYRIIEKNIKSGHLDREPVLIENQSFLASPPPFSTVYGRDIWTASIPKGWLCPTPIQSTALNWVNDSDRWYSWVSSWMTGYRNFCGLYQCFQDCVGFFLVFCLELPLLLGNLHHTSTCHNYNAITY